MTMHEIIVKGKGGQGAKTAIEILAKAANIENKYFLAYPEFGPERSGTPINAYFKVHDQRIRSREPIRHPDIILVLDKTLENYAKGLKKKGTLIVNSTEEKNAHYIDANKISMEISGKIIPNIIMLGALIKVTKIVKKQSVEEAINLTFDGKIKEISLKSFNEGYRQVV